MAQVYEDPTGAGGAQSGPWSFSGALAKGLAGAIGILTALIVDYIQKGNDSAVLNATRLINQAAMNRFGMQAVPPWVYLAVLLIAGFALVYIFEPTNKRNAFYAGAGVLGFLATFSPVVQQTLQIPPTSELPTLDSVLGATTPDTNSTAPAPATTPAPTSGSHAWNEPLGLPVVLAAYRPVSEASTVVRVQMTRIPVDILIQFPASQGTNLPEVSAWLHDSVTGRTLTLSAGATLARTSTGPVVVYRTSVAAGGGGARVAALALRVEAEGYAIATTSTTVGSDTHLPVRLEVTLVPSSTPLVLQRLQYPYRW